MQYRILLLATVLFIPLASQAQEEPSSKPTAEASSTADLEVPVEHLSLRLDPLTAPELEIEALAWQTLVKDAFFRQKLRHMTAKSANGAFFNRNQRLVISRQLQNQIPI